VQTEEMLSSNTILRERYRIIHQLGHGGMGAVYQAMDENLSCVVAVKETFATTDEQRRAFRREAELLANLTHPALPRVMDHFTDGEGQFLVMQFVPGHDLAELLDLREQPFPVAKVLDWGDQLLDALEELHSCNPPIIHRDIKPSNLKVTPKGRVLLLDFGLAKGAAGQMSTADAGSGGRSIYGYTAHYAPLEQMRGAGTDARSDLYALGGTLWTLLTGRVPPDALSRVGEKEEGNPDPLRLAHEINAQVPAAVSNALNQAMAVNRHQRQATAADLRNELRSAHPEGATQLLPQSRSPEPTSLPPDSDALSPTLKMLEPTSQSSPANPHNVPTIRVDSPPSVPSWDRGGNSATASFAGEKNKPGKTGFSFHLRWGRFALIVGSVLVMATSIVVWRATIQERPSLSATAPRPTSNGGNTTATNNPTAGTVVRNQQGIEMVWIPTGSFMMGSTNGGADEKPAHQVTINYSFYIGKYEVTQAQWQSVMGNNPSNFKDCGGNCPVEQVSWDDAQNFINKLNESNDGFRYRLPTEAEWEYACRAGTTGDYAGNLSEMAWYSENSGSKTHAVGSKRPNDWGLADMHGNVWEWCQDWYHDSYNGAPTDGSAWLSGGAQMYRALRGGSWFGNATYLRSACRVDDTPGYRVNSVGFRVVGVVRT
jgi:formylglycine-generating enzyme required for sulfatase activity